jgi:hypothetical protein
MSVGLEVGRKRFEIGSASFFSSFFSTVFVRLERGTWGARFPLILGKLHAGCLPSQDAARAMVELVEIERQLTAHPPGAVVWNHERLEQRPPWGDDIAPHITSLANYFWTADGKPLLTVVLAALQEAEQSREDVLIR